MASGKLIKGRFTVIEKRFTKQFMFNPDAITESKETEYGATKIPGVSHPVLQFGAGGERKFSFTLFIDGDRGRIDRRHPDGLNIKREVHFYQSLVLPAGKNTGQMKSVFPYLVSFSFGELYKQVTCVVRKADPRWTFFLPDLTPLRAEIGIELSEVVSESVTADEFFSFETGSEGGL